MSLTAKERNIGVVLVDLGPSSGLLNRVFVMSSDFILPPAFADRLSMASVDGLLNSILPDWYKWHARVLGEQPGRINMVPLDQQELIRQFSFSEFPPKLLPLTVTSYRVYNKGVTKGNAVWIKGCEQLVDKLTESVKAAFVRVNGRGVLPLCRNLGVLHQMAGKLRMAAVDLEDADIPSSYKRGDGGVIDQREIARIRYAGLASVILGLLNNNNNDNRNFATL